MASPSPRLLHPYRLLTGVVVLPFSLLQAVGTGVVAEQYATALVDLAKDKSALEAVRGDIVSLSALMESDKAALGFLANPVAPVDKKKGLLKTIGSESEYSPITSNFLNLLVDKARIKYLPEICDAFESLYCENTDTETATVVSAVKLDSDQQLSIAKQLQRLTGRKNIKLKPQIDENLLGGFVLKFGKDASMQIDMSIKGQLEKIEEDLMTSAPSM